uniref:B30.2/SPRY domain-containing protein n=1 Tax=Propithecus coquereli TaxID=379532 RepID=A0A2K6GD11_PROCO
PMRCRECREMSEKTDFKTDFVLKKLASLARQARPHQVHSSEEHICVAHMEVKGLFCETEKTLLCGPCSKALELVTHSHRPEECAAEQCREELIKTMEFLWKMTQETQNNLNQETSKTQLLADYVALRKMIIKIQYQRTHLFLHEEEQPHLEAMDREAEEIFQRLRDSEVRMTQHKERMKDMYRELTEMCHKLDDLGNVLERTKLVQMQKPQLVNPELTSWRITGLLNMLNNFRVDSPLSMEMVSCYISLTEHLRSVIFGDDPHGAHWELQTAESFAAWGAKAFTSGRHYWEVDVTHSSSWVLGVYTSIIIDSENAFLLFSLKGINGYSRSTNSPPLAQCVQRPRRVGVFLDYDNGTVSFYDVYKAALIYSFLPSSFSSPLRPFLYLYSP